MNRVLVIGATGLIGSAVASRLKKNPKYKVITQSRQNGKSDICCDLKSESLSLIISNCDYIINCAGVGLSKLRDYSVDVNTDITKSLLKAIEESGNKKVRLLHLSSMKAYNPKNYFDKYSDDKISSEKAIIQDNKNTLILRIPAVFGKDDRNLTPLIKLAKIGLLPLINDEEDLPKGYFIGCNDIALYIERWIDNDIRPGVIINYLVSSQLISYNDIVRFVYEKVEYKAINSLSICKVNKIYIFLSKLESIFSKRRRLPMERFDDLFKRNWTLEQSENISIIISNVNIKKLIGEYFE